MTDTDFDRTINRIGAHSVKWDALSTLYKMNPADSIPMWVADMEFAAPPCVAEALQRMLDHGVFGYYGDKTAYFAAIAGWMRRRHGWAVEPASIMITNGVVQAVATCIQTFSAAGDGVVLFTPVYHVFSKLIAANGRMLVESPLAQDQGRYVMDLDGLGARLTGRERMVILCSPHNPGGRVWSREELRALCAFCAKHDLLLVSDEIHHDLVMPGHRHVVTEHAAEGTGVKLVTTTSATKTFNLAGGHVGNVIIPDPALRRPFEAALVAGGVSPNGFGITMSEAAYAEGDAWLDRLLHYLDANRKLFDSGINAIPGLRSMRLEGTYLAWVDFAGTGMPREEFTGRVERSARLATNYGPTFGAGGESFLRFNIACPRPMLIEAVDRMREAFRDLQ